VNYKAYQWHICSDLKVIAVLMGLQKDYTKFCYSLCKWNSHAKSVYSKNNCLMHKSHTPGMKSVALQPLVHPCEVLLPPLHVKLGFMTNFVKALDRNGRHSHSCVRNYRGLLQRKLRRVYSLVSRCISSSETAVCHSRCILSIHTLIPFRLTVVP
jgi:hypothetical protein